MARLFLAVWPPAKTAAALHAWALQARRRTGGRATPTGMIHLTLAFLGEVEEARVEELQALRISGKRHELPIEQARYWQRNRIVWVGPEQIPEPLLRLSAVVNQKMKSMQLRSEAREFVAHITLIRNAGAPDLLPPLPRVRWPVEEVVLVRSRLAAAGPDYAIVERYALA